MLVELGPVKTFGLMFGLAFLTSGAVLARRLRETGRPADWAYELIFAALVGGYVGARIAWIIENPDRVDGPGDLIGGTGLVWYGGALGGALAVSFWARRKAPLGPWLFDACAAPLAIGYAVGRVGCQLSGDGDYGEPWSGPWAMPYPDGTVPTTEDVHPTPLYESFVMGLVALALWRVRDRVRPYGLIGLYLLAAGTLRFLVEFVRRNDAVLAGLTLPQLQSVLLVAAGAVLLVRIGGPFEPRPAARAQPVASA
jgi:phosphatidylglycerol---prolipoprotein diacylglyceryl transferase